jgi:hypothetical protein
LQNLDAHPEFWKTALDQIEVFTAYLTNIGIKTRRTPQNMGITTQGLLKCYLGLEFEMGNNELEDTIHDHYESQIGEMRRKFAVSEDESDNDNSLLVHHEAMGSHSRNKVAIPEKAMKGSLTILPCKLPNLSDLNK